MRRTSDSQLPRLARVAAALFVAASVAASVAACAGAGPTPTPNFTVYAIEPSPWAQGTTGQYGLRIDPSLLKRLPISVSGVAIVEDTLAEQSAMEDKVMSNELERYAAARAGEFGADNFLALEIVQFKPASQNADVYESWIDAYATAACAQAGVVGDQTQETIGNWLVDITTCTEGVKVYSLSLGDGQYLSMLANGPKELGKVLISHLF